MSEKSSKADSEQANDITIISWNSFCELKIKMGDKILTLLYVSPYQRGVLERKIERRSSKDLRDIIAFIDGKVRSRHTGAVSIPVV